MSEQLSPVDVNPPPAAPEIPVPHTPEPEVPVTEPPGITPPLHEPPVTDPPEVEPPQTDAPPVIEPPMASVQADASEPAAALEDAPTTTTTSVTAPPIPELSPAACAARLAELFPAVFTPGSPKPLKLRIQVDVQQRAPGLFTRRVLSGFLQRYTTGTAYLKALASAPDRVDLDGAPASPVSDEHKQAAVEELARRRALHDARRAAERDAQRQAQRDAQRAAQDEARRQHEARAADDTARRDRSMLLRAFETSTLTKSNFCALKRVSEAELDAQLAQARTERDERPPMPPPQRPMHHPDRPDTRPPQHRPDTRRADRPRDGDRDPRGGERRHGQHKPAHRRPPAPPKATP